MREFLRKMIRRIAPGSYTALEKLNQIDLDMVESSAAVDLVARIEELEKELLEMRKENRRAAELHDLVFARLREDNPLRVG